MRIHSDVLTLADFYAATANLPGVFVTVSQHGSRSHAHGFELSLEGNGYAKNTGTYGASQGEKGATWDEWGAVFSHLFEVDPNALAGSPKYPAYSDGYEFHYATNDRFEVPGELPKDTHKRHTWESNGIRSQQCKKCTAQRRF